jgi:transaldolase/glucose-6-phosphate isomerase
MPRAPRRVAPSINRQRDAHMNVVQKPKGQVSGNPLKQLENFGQSPWLDFIERKFLHDGSLQKLLDDDGLKGMTSNPSIFEKAMGHGTAYDDGFKALAAASDHAPGDIYEALAIQDIQAAADTLRPVYDATGRRDGYVSLEVSPYLAMMTDETIVEARRLWKAVGRENLMVKVPGTEPGVPAIRTLISEGININVTLLFAQSAYEKVAEAFIDGLEVYRKNGGDVSHVASVASFFISRIDVAIDKKIDTRLSGGAGAHETDLRRVRGKVAIAAAKFAYQHYLGLLDGPRWKSLAEAGAMPQRLLWASTGTKDPTYSDVLYVEELIGNETVNTMPPATMDAFRDHGKPRESLTENVEGARDVLATTDTLGLHLDEVTAALVVDGAKQFADAFDLLLGAVAAKRTAMLGSMLSSLTYKLPDDLAGSVKDSLATWCHEGNVRRLWGRDATLWTGEDEGKWLAWLHIVDDRIAHIDELLAFQADVQNAGFTHVLLLGMGGSSLGPEVLGETFGHRAGWPRLHVLDSTDPQQIATFEKSVDLAKTLCIVSSKSGGTLEPNILQAYFFDQMTKAVGAEQAGEHFVAVTDPGSHMQKVAEDRKFRHIFYGDPGIGGRYSVLSNFGMVPAAAAGIDLKNLLQSAALMVRSCGPTVPANVNPGVLLGTVMGICQRNGRDKVTLVCSPAIYDFGAWAEQLLAESTGKEGKGLVPIDGEPLGAPDLYGHDRLFVYLRIADQVDPAQERAIDAIEKSGQPVVRITLNGHMEIVQQFFLWEFATAVAGSFIGIDAFNQPDVEASKIATRKLTDEYNKTGKLPDEKPILTEGALSLFADERNAGSVRAESLDEAMTKHFARLGSGDYAAVLAYIERNKAHRDALQEIRGLILNRKYVATVGEFGPRFLHSTGQAYKGGPNSGVFLQVTADDDADLAVPGERYTFGIVKAAQARGDFDVLAERKRRALRVHITGDIASGLARIKQSIERALA